MFACLLFGFLDAASIRFQGQPWPMIGKVPVQFLQALRYVLTVVLLAVLGGAEAKLYLCDSTGVVETV
jgi:ABC-type uncharacterized transport system permease subunit